MSRGSRWTRPIRTINSFLINRNIHTYSYKCHYTRGYDCALSTPHRHTTKTTVNNSVEDAVEEAIDDAIEDADKDNIVDSEIEPE